MHQLLRPLARAVPLSTRGISSSLVPRIYVGGDGFGEELKNSVVSHLEKKGYSVVDKGTGKYYEKAADVAIAVQQEEGAIDIARGMLFCGTGMGVSLIANKFTGIRAAVVENEFAARASRSINDSNILCMGGLITSSEDATSIVDAWLAQEHQKPPVTAESEMPAWWSSEVEDFLASKWQEIEDIEKRSRSS